jgi:hypothetical protein
MRGSTNSLKRVTKLQRTPWGQWGVAVLVEPNHILCIWRDPSMSAVELREEWVELCLYSRICVRRMPTDDCSCAWY